MFQEKHHNLFSLISKSFNDTTSLPHSIFYFYQIWFFKRKDYLCSRNTEVAQLVEHWSPKPGVGSSSLSFRAKR